MNLRKSCKMRGLERVVFEGNAKGFCCWEKATQQRNDGKPFIKAYGYVPSGDTITWDLTDEGSTKLIWQKIPNHDNFDNLDWNPPPGSGGETEIPLSDPEINVPEPGENDPAPEPDFVPDPFDPGGGEPETPTIEPDPPEVDPGQDPDNLPDVDPPPIEPDPPEIDPNDPDTGRDPEGGDHDVPPPDLGDDDDDD